MILSEVLVSDCNEGDILADDIYNDNGVKLISGNTAISYDIKEHLYENGVERIRIYKPEDEKKEDSKIIRMADYYRKSSRFITSVVHDLAEGRKLDYDKVECITDQVYQYVEENGDILRMIDTIRQQDEGIYSHSINTAFYSMLIAKWLGWNKSFIKKAVQGGLLHDVGKSRIPVEILDKKQKLTNDEFEIIRKHPIYGYYILDENNFVDMDVKRATLLHHERTNRTGYPFRLSSDSIGQFAKVVSIADVYDAMTSNRVYKKCVAPFRVFEMFLSEGLPQFDTCMLVEFVRHITSYYIGSRVVLNTGESGKIVYIPVDDVTSPIVCVDNKYFNLRSRKDLKIVRIL